MVKRRGTTRKTRSNKKRTVRRMRGGTCRTEETNVAVSTCGELKSKYNPLYKHYKTVPVLEDCIKIANPRQKLCYGNTVTSCTTFTIVMENNWKIGVHMSTAAHYTGIPQNINPDTILTEVQTILRNNANFSGNIKYLYILGDADSFELSKLPGNGPYRRLNNNVTVGFKNISNYTYNNDSISLYGATKNTIIEVLNPMLLNKITPQTVIKINPGLAIKSAKGNYFLVKEDGTLHLDAEERLRTRTF